MWGYLDGIAVEVLLEPFRCHHHRQRIIERTHVGSYFVGEKSGQESQILAAFNRRAHQDDALHPLLLQGLHRHGHRQEGLARPGGAARQYDIVGLDDLYKAGLVLRLRLDRVSIAVDENGLFEVGSEFQLTVLASGSQQLGDEKVAEVVSGFEGIAHPIQGRLGLMEGGLVLGMDGDAGMAGQERDVIGLFQLDEVLFTLASQLDFFVIRGRKMQGEQ
jgi:hypothetical protein